MMRNLQGRVGFVGYNATYTNGVFAMEGQSANDYASGYTRLLTNFNASRVVPTGNANKPRAWGALACAYLGAPVS